VSHHLFGGPVLKAVPILHSCSSHSRQPLLLIGASQLTQQIGYRIPSALDTRSNAGDFPIGPGGLGMALADRLRRSGRVGSDPEPAGGRRRKSLSVPQTEKVYSRVEE
jgi:hypothetical protein